MRDFFYIAIAICVVLAFSRSNNEFPYDVSYEDGWEGRAAPSYWASEEERFGYEHGLDDAWLYDEGYDDGYNGRSPQFLNDVDYMDGYNDGKKDKRW